MNVFHGTVIHSLALAELAVLENALLVVGPDGVIQHLQPDVAASAVPDLVKAMHGRDSSSSSSSHAAPTIRYLKRTQFLIPGFVDTHNHAPQWAMRGLGQSMHILDWLDQITFPQEARFEDPAYARRVYERCVEGFLQQGVTTAAYYGSRHGEATRILADLCLTKGQRALVGKCNMDRQAPDSYRDADAAASLAETEACLAHVRRLDPAGALVRYVVTPRFAITCGPDLLAGLGALVRANPGLPVQTHFNEAEQEMRFTRELYPQFDNEVDLYAHYGLLTRDSILAHCCYMTEYEMQRFQELDCGVAHCPTSNMTVGGGFMAAGIRDFLDRGIKVGLGTDSGGGFSSSMLDALRHALIASNAREAQTRGAARALHPHEAFHLATLGGARVCGLGARVGSLEAGKDFDALVVDADPSSSPDNGSSHNVMTPIDDADDATRIFDKFLMTGDDRNIMQVYVRGRRVKG